MSTQPALTVKDVLELYLRHSAAEGVHGPAARLDRERTFQMFTLECGTLPVAEAKAHHLIDFIADHPSWESTSTRRSKADGIKAAFSWAVDEERIDRNPFRRVRYQESEPRPPMPDNVLGDVLACANKPFERALRFLRLTGCRLTELCEALWPDVDLEKGVWTIHRHKSRRFTGRPKLVALVPEAVELLRKVRRTQPPDYAGHIFLNNRLTPWNRRTLGQQLRRLKERHGIKTAASLHGLRHEFGHRAAAEGAPLKLIAQQLGHASVTTTERYYARLDAGDLDVIRQAAQLAAPGKELD